MAQVIDIRINEEEKASLGYNLFVGDAFVAHKHYNGSYKSEVYAEVEEALARILRRELTRDGHDLYWSDKFDGGEWQ